MIAVTQTSQETKIYVDSTEMPLLPIADPFISIPRNAVPAAWAPPRRDDGQQRMHCEQRRRQDSIAGTHRARHRRTPLPRRGFIRSGIMKSALRTAPWKRLEGAAPAHCSGILFLPFSAFLMAPSVFRTTEPAKVQVRPPHIPRTGDRKLSNVILHLDRYFRTGGTWPIDY
jgi:hypothetical protein